MDKKKLRTMYEKDEEGGCWHWHGGEKVRYEGRLHYPHRLIYELVVKIKLTQRNALIRRCNSEDCVNPDHMIRVDRDEPIKGHRWKPAI